MDTQTQLEERRRYYREYCKRWRAENKSKVKEYNHRYYHSRRKAFNESYLDMLEAELQALKHRI